MMLKINRLKVELKTIDGNYGIDASFVNGINFISSNKNTCGKSSILSAIYYALGFEEILGGIGSKSLSYVYRDHIEESSNDKFNIVESAIFLEISNKDNVITIFRPVKQENKDDKLITVYSSSLNEIYKDTTTHTDFFVHKKNSAMHEKGFHAFLEKFLELNIPLVPTFDGVDRKLYLQLIFSSMFIEQKHGWGDILAGMPTLGIKDAKKRVIEFVLNLDTLETERKKSRLKIKKNNIINKWKTIIFNIKNDSNNISCAITNIPLEPEILDTDNVNKLFITKIINNKMIPVDKYVEILREKYELLQKKPKKIVYNFNELQDELTETENSAYEIEKEIANYKKEIYILIDKNKVLTNNLQTIENDIQNNKDTNTLINLGADIGINSFKNSCPLCKQKINDILLPDAEQFDFMTIDKNITHLEAQKKMFEFVIENNNYQLEKLKSTVNILSQKKFDLQRLAKSIRNDLYSIDDNISEAIIYKKIKIEEEINNINDLKTKGKLQVQIEH